MRRRSLASGAAAVLAGSILPAVSGQMTPAEMEELAPRLPPAAAGEVLFDRDIRPIFENSCLQCHGPERPKSRFRLDVREEALKGGSGGVAIVPGAAARSPLLFYVAKLVEDMEMPPAGKAPEVTPEQAGLLRAWIDQGAVWGETNAAPKIQFSVTPALQWFSVRGNERMFREHTGLKDGWSGGVQSIFFQQQIDPNRRLTFQGRTFVHPEEYQFKLQLEQRHLGSFEAGFEQYREYYSDAGGYVPGFSPPAYALDRDLHLDIGRAWANFVLTLPDKPRVLLGYEYRYRDGSKSTLQWGDAGLLEPAFDPDNTDAKKIYPGARSVDERVHIVKFDLSHEINGFGLENSFRAEFYDNQTSRDNTVFFNTGTQTQDKWVLTRERHEHFQASDALHVEKQVLDWLFLSGGYYFSRLDGEYGFNNETISPSGVFGFNDPFWFTESIILEQNTHILNANTQLGPWDGLTLFGGVQGEWMSQRGFGDIRLDEGVPGAIQPAPATVDSDLDRMAVEERLGLRYTKIPFTVLFAEGRLGQESVGQTENELGGSHEFLRDTDANSHLAEGRFGFTLSPWTRVSLTAHYKYRNKSADFDHRRDEQFGFKNEGYSAFITSRETDTDEVALKLALRPASWLKTTLTYQKIATDYLTGMDSYILPELNIPGLPPIPAEVLAPGGTLLSGNYDADVYGINAAFVPWQRLSISSSFSYGTSRTTTAQRGTDAVAAYDGDVYSSISSATYAINHKTGLTAAYTYSWADYSQNHYATGLPAGLAYDWQIVSAALTRRFSERITATLQYRFYHYDEPETGGASNYRAHGLFAAVTMALK